MFLSKVPICKDRVEKKFEVPGPGTYNKDAKDTSLGASKTGSTFESSMNSTLNNKKFLSTTERRDDWCNDITAPFTKQSFISTPGPGQYPLQKKKDDIKSRLLNEETVHVPFGRSDERHCNKGQKDFGPGPGTYIDINNPNHSSICKSLNKIKEDRTLAESQGVKLGAFGSTSDRFTGIWNKTREGPGPGTY